jgi:hypothetical protein
LNRSAMILSRSTDGNEFEKYSYNLFFALEKTR